ncbi:MAG: PD-(D/E)XK nuclease family protein [Chloroflexi bacterium]|nr:PD-(D/E)XK nuclease family protein [Chloroflexota bacterium]
MTETIVTNAFESMQGTEGYGETFHSRFLAIALSASLAGDRSLFDGFWKLAAPPEWPVPQTATVRTERAAGDRRRIDLCIGDHERRRILGIEVKTRSAQAERGQLEAYERGLVHANPDTDIAVAYLTPFNRNRAGDAAERLPTVTLFSEFAAQSGRAGQHVSWLDVADISWDGNDIWRHHQAYVRNTIAPDSKLKISIDRNREFDEFFGKDATQEFWEALGELRVQPGKKGARIKWSEFSAEPRALSQALEILICGAPRVSRSRKSDSFSPKLRAPFLSSPWHAYHAELFELASRFRNVWIKGAKDYGVRVAHLDHPSRGVSLVTSDTPDVLIIGRRR